MIATGVQHSVHELTELVSRYVGIELKFEGDVFEVKDVVVKGPDYLLDRRMVKAVSEDLYHPTDAVNYWGDPTKAKGLLGWNLTRTSCAE